MLRRLSSFTLCQGAPFGLVAPPAFLFLILDGMPVAHLLAVEWMKRKGLALNCPKTTTVAEGLIESDRAQIEIQGGDNEDKKIKGVFEMKKVAGNWRVLEQHLSLLRIASSRVARGERSLSTGPCAWLSLRGRGRTNGMNKRCDIRHWLGTFGMCVAVLLCSLMAGCATIPAEECAKVDWYTLGVGDGRKGYTTDRVHKHRKACERVNITPDEEAYFAGRTEGLREYCALQNAFVEGLAGREYRSVCPPAVDRIFARNHSAGYAVYKVRDNLRSVENRIDSKEKELRKKKSDSERKELRNEIRELDEKREDLRDELHRLEAELDGLREKR